VKRAEYLVASMVVQKVEYWVEMKVDASVGTKAGLLVDAKAVQMVVSRVVHWAAMMAVCWVEKSVYWKAVYSVENLVDPLVELMAVAMVGELVEH
jgi:hypothetical protein